MIEDISLRDYYFINANKNFKFNKEKFLKLYEFMNNLSDLINYNGNMIMCDVKGKPYILNTLILDSTIKTLNSIIKCCEYGSFSDANILIRKYRDDLLLFLYILAVIENRNYITEEEAREIVGDEMTQEKFLKVMEKAFEVMANGSRYTEEDKVVNKWFENKIENNKDRNYLTFEGYMKYLKNQKDIRNVIDDCNLEKEWDEINWNLNDFTHNNGIEFTFANFPKRVKLKEIIEKIICNLEYIASFFITMLILIKPNIIMSTDFIDYKDLGLEPPDDIQYEIAPFVQEFIDEYIVKIHPELKSFLKDNNKYSMNIK